MTKENVSEENKKHGFTHSSFNEVLDGVGDDFNVLVSERRVL